MKCFRCGGLMVVDQCIQEDPPDTALVNRCLNCGEIMDPTILVNRQACPSFSWNFSDQVNWEIFRLPFHGTRRHSSAA